MGYESPRAGRACQAEWRDLAGGEHALEAELEVGLEPFGLLVAVLGGFGQQLHDNVGYHLGDCRVKLARRQRAPRDMAMHQLQRLARLEWQQAGDHLVERDTERIEVAAMVDRSVHTPGLLGEI